MGRTGLFGPGSVTWRLHADPLVGLAVLRALLLEALHPVASAVTGQRCPFPGDVWERLRRGAGYLGVTTYGATADALVAAARVRALLATTTARDPATGRPYRGDDEVLLLWGHCCRLDSVLDVVTRGGWGPGDADADAYVAEQARAAALLGLEPDVVPSTVAALAEHLDRTRSQLAVTPAARAVAAFVLDPRVPGASPPDAASQPPAWAAVAGLAFAALPGWGRRMYALDDPCAAASGTTLALRALREDLPGASRLVTGRPVPAVQGRTASTPEAWASNAPRAAGSVRFSPRAFDLPDP